MTRLLILFVGFWVYSNETSAWAQSVLVDAVQGGSIAETGSDGKTRALSDGSKTQAGKTIKTAAGQSARLLFEDGSELLLSQNSSVALEAKSGTTPHGAMISQGTVKVQVPSAKKTDELDTDIKVERVNDAPKPYRFQIHTQYVVLGVRGTEFLVEVDSKTKNAQVHTLEGTVDAGKSFQALNLGQRTALNANQSIQARSEKIEAPKNFDRGSLEKKMQAEHPQMMKVMNAPLRNQPDFRGTQIRQEMMRQQGSPSSLMQRPGPQGQNPPGAAGKQGAPGKQGMPGRQGSPEQQGRSGGGNMGERRSGGEQRSGGHPSGNMPGGGGAPSHPSSGMQNSGASPNGGGMQNHTQPSNGGGNFSAPPASTQQNGGGNFGGGRPSGGPPSGNTNFGAPPSGGGNFGGASAGGSPVGGPPPMSGGGGMPSGGGGGGPGPHRR